MLRRDSSLPLQGFPTVFERFELLVRVFLNAARIHSTWLSALSSKRCIRLLANPLHVPLEIPHLISGFLQALRLHSQVLEIELVTNHRQCQKHDEATPKNNGTKSHTKSLPNTEIIGNDKEFYLEPSPGNAR
jgi:hypothetical protein